jgi:hypothetical protein
MARMSRTILALLLLALAELLSARADADAQAADLYQVRIGVATFISRDRGWNYSEPVEILAALVRKSGSVELEAGASISKSFAGFGEPAISPAPPNPYRDGFRLRLGVRAPSPITSAVSGLIGVELVANQTDGEKHSATLGATAGVGLNFGPAKRLALDVRYIGFARRLGSSKGILPVSLAWRL